MQHFEFQYKNLPTLLDIYPHASKCIYIQSWARDNSLALRQRQRN